MSHEQTIAALNAVERECLKDFLRNEKVPTLRVLKKLIEVGLLRKGRDCYEECPGVRGAFYGEPYLGLDKKLHPAVLVDEEERHG